MLQMSQKEAKTIVTSLKFGKWYSDRYYLSGFSFQKCARLNVKEVKKI